ncbi:hypothetical protein IAQ61_004330 [Plenodomus lingam]|uniref:uncharacterized protein n=1 Tax=Leptosphaeria maculans TaxID=5022 RepID=UPI003318F9C5|nr:hypothetical protein IAQ61_004330 [Plenodomus lingam]
MAEALTNVQIELAFLLLAILALGLVKTSVCFLYWHLFATVRFRRVLIVWFFIIVGWTTSFILAGLLECGKHLKAMFGMPEEYSQRCGSAIPTGWAYVGSDVATDLITLIIPIPIIISWQLSTGRKLLVIATFMIGALSVGASVAKAYIYIEAMLGGYTEDAIVVLTGLSIWNLVEVQFGIIAACGPTLRPILTHILPTGSIRSLLGSMRAQKTSQNAEDLPSFVKIGAGTSGERNANVNEIAQNLACIDSHELIFLTGSNQKT